MDPADLDLPTLVSLAGGGVVQAILERMATGGVRGVRASHGYVVQRLVDEEPTISALAESLGMTQQGASKQVADLERLGYVERVESPGDRRIRRVRLTDAGRDMIEAGRAARREIENQVAARMGDADVEVAKAVLRAVLDIVGLDGRVRTRSVPLPPD